MQLCTIYKSLKKTDSYLYVEKTDDFSKVPEALMKMFGRPQLVMTIDLDKREKLGIADLEKVKQELVGNGFYLQLPPPKENLLDEFRKQNGVENDYE